MVKARKAATGAYRRSWLRGAPPPRWVRVLPVLLLVAVGAASLTDSFPLDIGFLLGAVPPLAVLAYGPLATAFLGAATIGLLTIPVFQLNRPGNTDLVTLGFVATLSVFVSFVRGRRDEQLDLERTVAETAQRAIVPNVRRRVGPVRCASLYRAAERGTLVGGDFFDVRPGPHGVRAVLGDVQGHGLSAIATVASVLGAFREAVLDDVDAEAIAARLDRRLVVDSARTEHAELFATAVLLDFAPHGREVRVLACGHPPPVLLRGGAVSTLELDPGPPLGLGLADVMSGTAATVSLLPGDRLLLASDGVLEARDASGAFYPFVERLARMTDVGLDQLPDEIWADLSRFAPKIQDDVTLLILTLDTSGPD
ncbi:PP2C family protein-serine/threonine phosphatase [Streptomyces sp. TX20-6-3]|uniref:PP2C family protein-serine/threonine phosphatase n=1 Tax=Streptomyces sp. TX20-6-3 TaxID=3028705 RepID=UPI0029AF9A5E|nr:PP2C family protein-serine/threonine phosphatase [Streptomyces sp. TX20-6-3]MDX2562893.1 PP2C family protein-serine/threonine phosphatase [Streptomyces sp. TX20-6-3]